MITIQAKSKTGQLVDFEVDRIVSIDGEPYTASASEIRDHLMVIEGRMQAVESMMQINPLAGV